MRRFDKSNNIKNVNLLAEQRYLQSKGLINEDLGDKKRKIVVLVGPPSVGKSTWTQKNFPNAYIINRDDIVEKVASKYGWTYDDMFATPPADAKVGEVDDKYGEVIGAPSWMSWAKTVFDKVLNANSEVQNLFNRRVGEAHPSGKDIIVDMTNMNPGARKGALKAIEGNENEYTTVAVDFKFAGAEEIIKKMAAKRAEAAQRMGKSKTIPPAAFDRMFQSYVAPSNAEGFDEIISVDNISNLKNALLNEKSLETENAEASLEKSIMQGIKSSVKENESDCIQHYYNNPHELGPGETPEGKCRNF
jgi:GTPase SAR1 family protein